jgi:hypothetical protein
MHPATRPIRTALRWPLWLLSPFGAGHDFGANPVLGSRLLNRLGLHVLRLVLAHAVTALRRGLLRCLLPPAERAAFARDGFLLRTGVLSGAELAALKEELAHADGEFRQCVQGDTLTQRLLLDDEALARLPVLRRLLHDPAFTGPLRYVAASARRPHFYLQAVRNGAGDGAPDPQKALHSDTFQPSMKAWFFPEAVRAEDGPFNYVTGSHRLDWRRLRWEYRRSLVAAGLRDGYSEKGSFRFSPEDLAALGLPAPRALEVPANTLVIADTCGIHCRGGAAPGARRLAIWAYGRTNPFNPWPGVVPSIVDRWELALTRRRWRRLDRAAERRGQRSSWHPIPAAVFHGQEPPPGSRG